MRLYYYVLFWLNSYEAELQYYMLEYKMVEYVCYGYIIFSENFANLKSCWYCFILWWYFNETYSMCYVYHHHVSDILCLYASAAAADDDGGWWCLWFFWHRRRRRPSVCLLAYVLSFDVSFYNFFRLLQYSNGVTKCPAVTFLVYLVYLEREEMPSSFLNIFTIAFLFAVGY